VLTRSVCSAAACPDTPCTPLPLSRPLPAGAAQPQGRPWCWPRATLCAGGAMLPSGLGAPPFPELYACSAFIARVVFSSLLVVCALPTPGWSGWPSPSRPGPDLNFPALTPASARTQRKPSHWWQAVRAHPRPWRSHSDLNLTFPPRPQPQQGPKGSLPTGGRRCGLTRVHGDHIVILT